MRVVMLLLLLMLSPIIAAEGIPRWDALPAVDVDHLQGPYAGLSVCPMCRHGYDAGVLLYLPSGTAPSEARRIARALLTVSAGIGDPRFRPFLVFAGGSPSPALLAAVADDTINWHVGQLGPGQLIEASREFRRDLGGTAWGYVFAQRRLLWSFEPMSDPDWRSQVAQAARYAMQFLQATYATAVASADPDAPKGQLWLAPRSLDSHMAFGSEHDGRVALCFAAALPAHDRDALVGASTSHAPRIVWARTDADGCVTLQGQASAPAIRIDLFRVLQPTSSWQLASTALHDGARIDIDPIHAADAPVTGREPIVGLPCENCELVFRGLPPELAAIGRIAPIGEPGEALRVTGTVRDSDGRPRAGVVIYAYQTDHTGHYPADAGGVRHGRLRGWVRSDAQGRYTLHTIRPGAYPGTTIPQHIHLHVIEPGRCTYTIDDLEFDDDPRLPTGRQGDPDRPRGGDGVVHPTGDARSGWTAVRDIALGLNVPGYAGCVPGVGT